MLNTGSFSETQVNLPLSLSRERSGSVVESLTRDREATGLSLTGVTALWSLSMNINPSIVLVQPRKTCPFITESLLMGRKESNQTNKQTKAIQHYQGLQIRVCIEKYFLYFSSKTYVVGTQKNRLNETVLLITQNTCLN